MRSPVRWKRGRGPGKVAGAMDSRAGGIARSAIRGMWPGAPRFRKNRDCSPESRRVSPSLQIRNVTTRIDRRRTGQDKTEYLRLFPKSLSD